METLFAGSIKIRFAQCGLLALLRKSYRFSDFVGDYALGGAVLPKSDPDMLF